MLKFFSLPPDGATTEYQISNRIFSDFLCTYYCDFLNNMYSYGSFFLINPTDIRINAIQVATVGAERACRSNCEWNKREIIENKRA